MNKKIILVLLTFLVSNILSKEQSFIGNDEMRAKYQKLKILGKEIIEQDNLIAAIKQKMEHLFAIAKDVKKQKLIAENQDLKSKEAELDEQINDEILTLFNNYFDLSKTNPVSIGVPFEQYFSDLLDQDEIALLKFYAVKCTFDSMDLQESLEQWNKLSDELMNFGRNLMSKEATKNETIERCA